MDRINRFLKLRPQKKHKSFIHKNKVYTVTQAEIKQVRRARMNKCDVISLSTKKFYTNSGDFKFEKVRKNNFIEKDPHTAVKRPKKNKPLTKPTKNTKKTDNITKDRDLDSITNFFWSDATLQPRPIENTSVSNRIFNNDDLNTIILNRDNKYLIKEKKIKIENILKEKDEIEKLNTKFFLQVIRKYKCDRPTNICGNIIQYSNESNPVQSDNQNLVQTHFVDIWSFTESSTLLMPKILGLNESQYYFQDQTSKKIIKRSIFQLDESEKHFEHFDVKSNVQKMHIYSFDNPQKNSDPSFFYNIKNEIFLNSLKIAQIAPKFSSLNFFQFADRLFVQVLRINQLEIFEIHTKKLIKQEKLDKSSFKQIFVYKTGANIISTDLIMTNNGFLFSVCADVSKNIHLNILKSDGNLLTKRFCFASFPNAVKILNLNVSQSYSTTKLAKKEQDDLILSLGGNETVFFNVKIQETIVMKLIAKHSGFDTFYDDLELNSKNIWGWGNGTLKYLQIHRS